MQQRNQFRHYRRRPRSPAAATSALQKVLALAAIAVCCRLLGRGTSAAATTSVAANPAAVFGGASWEEEDGGGAPAVWLRASPSARRPQRLDAVGVVSVEAPGVGLGSGGLLGSSATPAGPPAQQQPARVVVAATHAAAAATAAAEALAVPPGGGGTARPAESAAAVCARKLERLPHALAASLEVLLGPRLKGSADCGPPAAAATPVFAATPVAAAAGAAAKEVAVLPQQKGNPGNGFGRLHQHRHQHQLQQQLRQGPPLAWRRHGDAPLGRRDGADTHRSTSSRTSTSTSPFTAVVVPPAASGVANPSVEPLGQQLRRQQAGPAAVQFTAARCTDILAWAVEAASHPHPAAADAATTGYNRTTADYEGGLLSGVAAASLDPAESLGSMGPAGSAAAQSAAAAGAAAAGFDWSWSAAPPLTSPTRLSALYSHCLSSGTGSPLLAMMLRLSGQQPSALGLLGPEAPAATEAAPTVTGAALLAVDGSAALHQSAAVGLPSYSHVRGIRQVFGASTLPVNRPFTGFPADVEIIGLLALALTQQQNNVGRDTSANSGLATTFRGVTFPFGVSFATTNSFGGAVQQAFDFATATDQRGAAADGLETGRAIGSVPFGDVNVVTNVLSSALSQRRLVRPRSPPQPPHRQKQQQKQQQQQQQDAHPNSQQGNQIQGPLGAAGGGSSGGAGRGGSFRDGAQQQQPGAAAAAAGGGATANNGTAVASEGDGAAAQAASALRAAELLDEYAYWNGYMGTFYNVEYDVAAAADAPRDPHHAYEYDDPEPQDQQRSGGAEGSAPPGNGIAGTTNGSSTAVAEEQDGSGPEAKAAAAAARRRKWQRRAQAAIAAAEAGDEEYAAALMGWSLAPPAGTAGGIPRPPPLPQQQSGPTATGGGGGGDGGAGGVNASDVQLRTGDSSQQQQSQMSSNAGAGNGTNGTSSGAGRGGVNQYLYDPFDVLLAATLEYGRAGQYSYFYTDYYRFLSTYYSGPVIVPQTALGRTRSTSAVVRDDTATTAGSTKNAATGLNVATVVQSVSAAIRGISQSLRQSDILGNSTFTGAPQQPTRQAGVLAGGLTFGRGYFFQAPSESFTKAATTSSIGVGGAVTAGAAGSVTGYGAGTKFSGARSQISAQTGEENLDFDLGG